MAINGGVLQVLQGVYGGHASPTGTRGTAPLIPVTDWAQVLKKYAMVKTPADAAASTASEPNIFSVTPNFAGGILVFNVWILPDAALTANGSNFASYQFGTRPQAGGGSQTTLGSAVTTAAVSWVANSQIALFTSAGGQAVAQNLQLTVAITKSGTGVVTPQTTWLVEFMEA